MANCTTFIFGSGSSRGTLGENLPTSQGFGKRLADFAADFPALNNVAEHLDRPLSSLSLEELWTCVDYHAKFANMLPEIPSWDGAASRELKKALLRIYGQACDRTADKLPLEGAYTLRDILVEAQPGDTLISFNYDTLVERLAVRFGLTLRSCNQELRRDFINFVKPHGSTSWCLDLNSKSVAYTHPDGAPLLDSLSENEVLRLREPLVVGAVPIKSELLLGEQYARNLNQVFDVIALQWRGVIKAVQGTTRLVVLGYSFPIEDHYGRFLFTEAVRARPTPITIDCYEKKDRWCQVKKSIEEIFSGRIASLTRLGEVIPPQ